MISNIVFDLDGTLIDSSDGVVEAVNYSLKAVGEPPQEPDRIRTYIGFPLDKMYPDFTDQPVPLMKKYFQEKASQTVVASTVALPGVDPVLQELRIGGHRMAIATTKIRPHIEGILERLHWRELFDATVGGDEVAEVKPSPEPFLKAVSLLNAHLSECVVVGDTINDVAAAKAAGLLVIGVKSPYGDSKELKESKPDHFIELISELPALIGSLNGSRR